jgi:hypothetical protein
MVSSIIINPGPGDVIQSGQTFNIQVQMRNFVAGAFTNAFAIFPQVDFHPHPSVLLRGGVLVAWAPEPVVDPLASLQARDGATIDDDLVNFAGGKPGQFYGTELCGRAQWRFMDHFAADLEGALLFPGDALEDENHDAVNSFLVQTRTTFFF